MRSCGRAFIRVFIRVLALAALLLLCVGCDAGAPASGAIGASSATAPIATPTSVTVQGTVHDYATLVAALTAAGATAQPGQDHPSSILFDAPSRDLLVNGSDLLGVFVYPTTAAAKTEAGCFHGGNKQCPGERGGSTIDYAAPPHLYLAGRILVLYVGTATATLRLLASVLGPPVDEAHWG